MAKKLINNSGTTVGDIYDASIYNNTKATKKSYSRSDAFPIENSMIFYSLEDAQKYAKGDENDPDLRELYSLAYQGQIISVITGQKTIETYKYKHLI